MSPEPHQIGIMSPEPHQNPRCRERVGDRVPKAAFAVPTGRSPSRYRGDDGDWRGGTAVQKMTQMGLIYDGLGKIT